MNKGATRKLPKMSYVSYAPCMSNISRRHKVASRILTIKQNNVLAVIIYIRSLFKSCSTAYRMLKCFSPANIACGKGGNADKMSGNDNKRWHEQDCRSHNRRIKILHLPSFAPGRVSMAWKVPKGTMYPDEKTGLGDVESLNRHDAAVLFALTATGVTRFFNCNDSIHFLRFFSAE